MTQPRPPGPAPSTAAGVRGPVRALAHGMEGHGQRLGQRAVFERGKGAVGTAVADHVGGSQRLDHHRLPHGPVADLRADRAVQGEDFRHPGRLQRARQPFTAVGAGFARRHRVLPSGSAIALESVGDPAVLG